MIDNQDLFGAQKNIFWKFYMGYYNLNNLITIDIVLF
jgi:hypothetical protein